MTDTPSDPYDPMTSHDPDDLRAPVGDPTRRCPCGTGRPYGECCGALHAGGRDAATAEQLMRSRYSAFAVGDAAYLSRTWHPSTRPRRIHLHADDTWIGLEVRSTTGGGLLDEAGTVEFEARCRRGGEVHVVQERSRFERVEGRWVYVGPVG